MPYPLANIIKDLINDTTAGKSFQGIKEELIKQTSQSAETRFTTLINEEQLNGRSPSQFLRRMREVSGEMSDGPLFRQLFISRLPTYVQGILASMDENSPIELLEKMADKILEVFTSSKANTSTSGRNNHCTCSNTRDLPLVAAVTLATTQDNETLKAIQSLTKQMDELLREHQRTPRRSHFHERRRVSRSMSRR